MRYYLDQRLKFWLAMMGALTLLYVHFMDENGKRIGLHLKLASKYDTPRAEKLVVLQRSSEYDSLEFFSVNNAMEYARQTQADFLAIDREWGQELSQLTLLYPKGVLLLDGTPRNHMENVVTLPMNLVVKNHAGKSNSRPVGIVLHPEDFEILVSYCYGPYPGANGAITSAVRSCSKIKINSTIYLGDV